MINYIWYAINDIDRYIDDGDDDHTDDDSILNNENTLKSWSLIIDLNKLFLINQNIIFGQNYSTQI